jgi:hypothetical protein
VRSLEKGLDMKATQVFTPGKLPDVTYVDDHLHGQSKLLNDALDAGATVVSLSGPSKSGKTTFVEKVLGIRGGWFMLQVQELRPWPNCGTECSTL